MRSILVLLFMLVVLAGCVTQPARTESVPTVLSLNIVTPTLTPSPAKPSPTATLVNPNVPTVSATGQVFRRFPELARDHIGAWVDTTSLSLDNSKDVASRTGLMIGPLALKVRDSNPKVIAMAAITATVVEQVISTTQNVIGPYDALLLTQVGQPAKSDSAASAGKLLTAIRPLIGTRLLMASTYAWADGTAFAEHAADAKKLLSQVDGACICDFLRREDTAFDGYKSVDDWKKDVDELDQLSRTADTTVLTATRMGKVPADKDAAYEQWFDYALASYLLGANGYRTYFSFQGKGADTFMQNYKLTIQLGIPNANYSYGYGLYSRVFTQGVVVVNPSSVKAQMLLPHSYLTSGGVAVTRITLEPHTGVILKTVR